jgi:GAF domain-containing protein
MQKGVCGTAAYSRKTIIVDDVNEFPGHIACDVDSRSEIVIPLEYKGKLLGVLDIDSPKLARFTEQDAIVLQQLCTILIDNCSWPEL